MGRVEGEMKPRREAGPGPNGSAIGVQMGSVVSDEFSGGMQCDQVLKTQH